MGDYELNPGILLGSVAAIPSLFAALAALYLWAVNRFRQRLKQSAASQERAVLPWLRPLLLPTLAILCLGTVAQLSKVYEEKSWPEASHMIITAWAAFMVFMFWLKVRKTT